MLNYEKLNESLKPTRIKRCLLLAQVCGRAA